MTDYTPYEITLLAKQHREAQYCEFENLLSLAWHTEALARQRKLPSLERILKNVRKKPKKAKNSASDAILKAMAAEKGVIIK